MKLLTEQPELKKLINTTELEYMRDKRMHELDEQLLYAIDEKATERRPAGQGPRR